MDVSDSLRNVYCRAGTPRRAPSSAVKDPTGAAQCAASHALHCSELCSLHWLPLVGVPPTHVHWFVAQPKSDEPVVEHVPVRCWPAGHDVRHGAQPKFAVPVALHVPVRRCPTGHDERHALHSWFSRPAHVPPRYCPAGHDARHAAQRLSDVCVDSHEPVRYCPAAHDAVHDAQW